MIYDNKLLLLLNYQICMNYLHVNVLISCIAFGLPAAIKVNNFLN